MLGCFFIKLSVLSLKNKIFDIISMLVFFQYVHFVSKMLSNSADDGPGFRLPYLSLCLDARAKVLWHLLYKSVFQNGQLTKKIDVCITYTSLLWYEINRKGELIICTIYFEFNRNYILKKRKGISTWTSFAPGFDRLSDAKIHETGVKSKRIEITVNFKLDLFGQTSNSWDQC